MKKTLLAATALSGVLLAGTAQTATAGILDFLTAEAPGGGFHAGNFLVHARMIGVLPNTDADAHVFTNQTGTLAKVGSVDITQTIEPEVDASFFITDNIAAEIIAGTTKHSLHLKGTTANDLAGSNDILIGDTRLLPPTLTAKYYFMPYAAFSPYLGAGINYTWFFDTHPHLPQGAVFGGAVHLQDQWGGVLQAGIDYNFAGGWYLNLDIKHIFLTTSATVTASSAALGPGLTNVRITADTTIDPTIVGFGIGYKF